MRAFFLALALVAAALATPTAAPAQCAGGQCYAPALRQAVYAPAVTWQPAAVYASPASYGYAPVVYAGGGCRVVQVRQRGLFRRCRR